MARSTPRQEAAAPSTRDAAKPRRLGRGLSSLMGQPVRVEAPQPEAAAGELPVDQPALNTSFAMGQLVQIRLDDIQPNRFQPRREFDKASLEGLAASITTAGVMQPIAVRRRPAGPQGSGGSAWELIAGERRWRAARLAGLTHVPAVISDLTDQDAAEWAIVENLQREDLNPIERAWAFRRLSERFDLTHQQIAERVGLDRSSIANLIRLTELEDEIQLQLAKGALSLGHGKALLSIRAGIDRLEAARRCTQEAWSVRRLEAFAATEAPSATPPSSTTTEAINSSRRQAALRDMERRLGEHLSTRVRIRTDSKGKRGQLRIEFYDLDHFESLLTRLGLTQD